jgi:hypothetical protein
LVEHGGFNMRQEAIPSSQTTAPWRSFCPPCDNLQKYSNSFLQLPENKMLWQHVCYCKNPPNGDLAYIPRNRLLEATTGRARRTCKQINPFVAGPTKGKMGYEQSGRSMNDSFLRKIRNNLDPTIDFAYAERCVVNENKKKENVDPKTKQLYVTLPNSGKSKASCSKQNRTLVAIFNQAKKALAQDKVTPNCYRVEGMKHEECHAAGAHTPRSCFKRYVWITFQIDYLLKLNRQLTIPAANIKSPATNSYVSFDL